VCHLAYTFYETDNRVMRYARALVERGDEVDVIALRRSGQPRTSDVGGVRVTRVQRRVKTEGAPWTYFVKILWFMLLSLLAVSLRQVRRRYDVVHVHNVPDFLVFSALLPKLTGTRVILDIHDILPELYAGKFGATTDSAVFRALLLVERLSCRFADHVIVANHIWHDRLIERAVPAAKCLTILNYPDLRQFRPRPKDTHGKFVILYPGSLSRHQGLDVAIRAFARVRDRLRDAEFRIYGEGPAREELLELVHQLGLDGRVVLRDPLLVDQIAEVIGSVDLGVEPKLATGFGNEALSTKILEFMASGVPIIVSRTMAHAHYFREPDVTFFTSGNDAELAEALLKLSSCQRDEGSLKRAQDFAARYDWRIRVADYYQLIEGLTGAEPRQATATS
jgi:glycosyltransferase involved in cell wall biosynthesis